MKSKLSLLFENAKFKILTMFTDKKDYEITDNYDYKDRFLSLNYKLGELIKSGAPVIELYREFKVIENELFTETNELKDYYKVMMRKYQRILELCLFSLEKEGYTKDLYKMLISVFYQMSTEMVETKSNSNIKTLKYVNPETDNFDEKKELEKELENIALQNSRYSREKELEEIFKEKTVRTYEEVRKEFHNLKNEIKKEIGSTPGNSFDKEIVLKELFEDEVKEKPKSNLQKEFEKLTNSKVEIEVIDESDNGNENNIESNISIDFLNKK